MKGDLWHGHLQPGQCSVNGLTIGTVGDVVVTKEAKPLADLAQSITSLSGSFTSASINMENLAAVLGDLTPPPRSTIELTHGRKSVTLRDAEVREMAGGLFEITCRSATVRIERTPREVRIARLHRRHEMGRDCRTRMRVGKLFKRSLKLASETPFSLESILFRGLLDGALDGLTWADLGTYTHDDAKFAALVNEQLARKPLTPKDLESFCRGDLILGGPDALPVLFHPDKIERIRVGE